MDAYSPKDVLPLLGGPRVAIVLNAADNAEEALEACAWELDLGQALLKPIGLAEVIVRNSIDSAINQWWMAQDLENTWTTCSDIYSSAPVLAPFVHRTEWEKRAKQYLHEGQEVASHDDMISHATLGTWKNMVGNPAGLSPRAPIESERRESWEAARKRDAQCARLWKDVLYQAFPNIPKTKKERGKLSPRAYIGLRLSRMGSLRNRVCHWDNLRLVNVKGRYQDALELIRSVSLPAYEWAREICDAEIADCLSRRPEFLSSDAATSANDD